jgi:hypothetical protein
MKESKMATKQVRNPQTGRLDQPLEKGLPTPWNTSNRYPFGTHKSDWKRASRL